MFSHLINALSPAPGTQGRAPGALSPTSLGLGGAGANAGAGVGAGAGADADAGAGPHLVVLEESIAESAHPEAATPAQVLAGDGAAAALATEHLDTGVRRQVPGDRCQETGVRRQVSGGQYPPVHRSCSGACGGGW